METIKKYIGITPKPPEADFFGHFWSKGWTYIKTVVSVVDEPVLVLDENFQVIAANESFYKTFKVELKDTEGKIIYDLGDGQWNIPALKKHLENIVPGDSFFKGFQVAHDFLAIGRKVMILNARRVYFGDKAVAEELSPIIILAMEDVTDMMVVAEALALQASQLEAKLMTKSQQLEMHIGRLEKELSELKNK